jgi:CRP/FNR family transcriptional regulator, cyclic AMP receptor protein
LAARKLPHRLDKTDIRKALQSFGKSVSYRKNEKIFSQDTPALEMFFVESGEIKISATSRQGKEVVVSILGPGTFLGESTVAGRGTHVTTASAISDCAIRKIRKRHLLKALHQNPQLSDMFMKFILKRNFRIEADLIDQLFNSIEKRLARTLLLLAHFGKTKRSGEVVPGISQEVLAKMVGTTRSRVNLFMNRFRELGFIEYNGKGLRVSDSLVQILLRD